LKQLVHDRLLRWGLSLAYLAMLGGLVIWVNPFLEEVRGAIALAALLPAAVIGIGLIAMAKIAER
jgi:cytochrome c oxidase subunit IV